YLPWVELRRAKISPTAVILFTSGSEAKPKAVPLSHQNIISNYKDYLVLAKIRKNERLLGMLPPFHSFGLACGVILPLCTGIKFAFHANPNEGAILADMIDRYQLSILLGTPTFVYGILRVATPNQLRSVRLAVTGAEKCPEYVYQKIKELCPHAIICEGYGITECSPVVTLNNPDHPMIGSLGKVLQSMEYCVVHPESIPMQKNPPGEKGLLLVRGPNVFSGYLNHPTSPFVELSGKKWYNTGDLVTEDDKGIITFVGRLKRFIKMGGEMISLVAIEEALSKHYPANDDGPSIAVESIDNDNTSNPELILFTTQDVTREQVNQQIRSEGLSGLYNIRRIIKKEKIPLLGTGKTDYRQLKDLFQK
ncbi:MAG: AMP-binding protein, partial [Pseudomonadota bacterium]